MSEPTTRNAIRLAPGDNVATVLAALAAGQVVVHDPREAAVPAGEAIPLCHKVALVAIAAGEPVLKYGEPIGRATAAIAPGAHVHVHNMRSARALGRENGDA